MEELCDLMRREVHALHARMDHEVRCAPPPRQGSVPCHGRLARDRPRAFTFGSLGAAGGARRLDYAVQAAALLGGRRHRMGRGPYLHVFYRISWRTLPHMRSGLRPRAGLPSLAPAAAPRPFPRRTALRRRRVMQQLLDTVRIDQEGAASLAVDWAADTDCVDLVLGPCAPVASPVARRPSPAPPQRHHCPGWRCSPRSPRHDAPQWTRSRARWPTSGTRPAPPSMGSGRPPHDRARACTARPASGLGRMRLDPPARHARTATQGAAAAAQRRHTCTSALLFTLRGPFRVGGGTGRVAAVSPLLRRRGRRRSRLPPPRALVYTRTGAVVPQPGVGCRARPGPAPTLASRIGGCDTRRRPSPALPAPCIRSYPMHRGWRKILQRTVLTMTSSARGAGWWCVRTRARAPPRGHAAAAGPNQPVLPSSGAVPALRRPQRFTLCSSTGAWRCGCGPAPPSAPRPPQDSLRRPAVTALASLSPALARLTQCTPG